MSADLLENEELKKDYREFDRDLRVRQTRIGALLAIILVPAGSSLEYFIYPEYLKEFFIILFLSRGIFRYLQRLNYIAPITSIPNALIL